MPNNVDERVVQMRIDNKQFVKGAEKTISVLDRLKTALGFKEQTEELEDFQRVSSRLDLSGITDALETVSDKFTVLGILGKRVIENLADSMYSFGVNLVKSFSIDQISTGYSKYEQKAKSVQTMMAASAGKIGTEYENQEGQLEAINAEMDRLMFFTDETSYSFSGLSSNMAMFMSSGIGIRDARIDLQGVAAAAGIAGSSVEQANHAMNNFSQAMAMGTLKVQDWQSLEIAGIVTDEFKRTLVETAVECKKLKKVGEDMYRTLDGKKTFNSAGVRDALSTGFADREVIEKTLHKYGEFSDVLNTVSDLTGANATTLLKALDEFDKGELDFIELQKEIAEYVDDEEVPAIEALEEAMKTLSAEELDLGRRAFKASQEYNSFNDAINATKEAVSTGWMVSFQHIFGDYLEAKKVWTAIGEELYDIFASSAERRNAILEKWKEIGGRDAFLQSMRNIFDGFMSIIEPIKEAFDDIFNLGSVNTAAKKIFNLTTRFRDFTAKLKLSSETAEHLRLVFRTLFETVYKVGIRAFEGITAIFKEFNRILIPIKNAIRNVFTNQYITGFSDRIDGLISRFFSFVSSLKLSDKALNGLGYILTKIFGIVKDGSEKINEGFFSKIISGIGKVIVFLRNLLNLVLESFAGGFSKDNLLNGLSEMFYNISDVAGMVWDKIVSISDGIYSFISKIVGWFSKLENVVDAVVKVFNFLKNVIKNVIDGLVSALGDKNLGNNILKIAASIGAIFSAFLFGDAVIWQIKSTFKPFLELLASINDAFWALGERLRAAKWLTYGQTFKEFGMSLLMLSVSLWILASIDINKLANATMFLTEMMLSLVVAIGLLSRYGGKGLNAATLGAGILELASAVLTLTLALALLSVLNPERLASALNVLLTVLFAVAIVSGLLSRYAKGGNFALLGLGLLGLASAIFTLSVSLAVLSLIDPKKLSGALEQFVIMLVAIVVAAGLLSKFAKGGNLVLVGFGLMEISLAILVLVGAIALLSLVDPVKASNSLLILAVALMAIAVVTYAMPATLPLIGAGLIFVAVAIALIAATLALLTLIDPIKLIESLGLIAIALIGLAVILNAFSTAIVGAVALLVVGAALALAAVGIIIFAMAMRILQGVDLASITTGLLLVSPALIALASALIFLTFGLIGAATLAIAALGLIALGIALNTMTGLPFPVLADGLTMIGMAFIVLGTGGVAMALGVPGLLAGALALVLMAVAMIPFAAALHMFDSVSFDSILKFLLSLAGTGAVLAAFTPILAPLSVAIAAFGLACAAAGAGIWLAGIGMEKIAESLTVIPNQTADAFKSIAIGVTQITGSILTSGEEALAAIGDLGLAIISAINNTTTNINTTLIESRMTLRNTLTTTMTVLTTVAESKIADFETIGGNIAVGMLDGINGRSGEVLNALQDLVNEMINVIIFGFDIHSPSRVMEELLSRVPEGAAKGLEENGQIATEAMSDMGSKMLSAIYPSLEILSMLLNEEYNFSPTITPVVDMSDVTASSAAIQSLLSSSDAAIRASGAINASVDNAGKLSTQMDEAMYGSASSNDSFVINVYSQPGMNENDIANAVLYKIQNGIVRKGAALG